MRPAEKLLAEAVSNLFKNKESNYGISKRPKDDLTHGVQTQWEGIQYAFALKASDSPFCESLTSAFYNIRSYKYLNDPTFSVAFEKQLSAMGVPSSERKKGLKFIEEVKKEYAISEDFDETEAGWHPDLDEIADMTRNANNRKPLKSEPLHGGGPAPEKGSDQE